MQLVAASGDGGVHSTPAALRTTEEPSRARRAREGLRRLGRAGVHVLVVTLFGLPGVALWWHAWDGGLSSTLTCACGDTGQAVWFVAWPAYAMAHGINPFFSAAVQYPYGANLLANASSVPVGIVLAPITWTAGPVAATNVALTLSPALSAWAGWAACRHFARGRVGPVVAGMLFGYSPFVVTNLALGHIGLSLLVFPPLLVVTAHRLVVGTGGRRGWWAAAFGALVGLQFLVSSEILAILAVVGAPVALVAALAYRDRLAPTGELVRALGLAALVAAVLLAAPVWFFLAGPQHLHGPLWHVEGNTLDAFWDPGRFRSHADPLVRLGGYEGQEGPPPSFLGPVVLALGAASLALAWRRRAVWLLALGALVAAVCSLGAVLWVAPGRASALWLPWRIVAGWPLLYDVIPQRFSAVVDLCVALLVGLGMDAACAAPALGRQGGRRRTDRRRAGATGPPLGRAGWLPAAVTGAAVLAGAAAVASLWATYQVPLTTRRVALPPWYAAAPRRVASGTVVLSDPFPFPRDGSSAAMVWQAMDGMRFGLAGGYLKVPGPGGRPLSASVRPPYGALAALTSRAGGPLDDAGASSLDALRSTLVRWRVDEVVVTESGARARAAVSYLSRALGRPPQRVLGAWVFELSGCRARCSTRGGRNGYTSPARGAG